MALILFDASICANDHIICGWLLILLVGTGNPLGMGLGQILDPSRVVGLFADIIYIRGHGFGMAKPSGFEPIAIPTYCPGRAAGSPEQFLQRLPLRRSCPLVPIPLRVSTRIEPMQPLDSFPPLPRPSPPPASPESGKPHRPAPPLVHIAKSQVVPGGLVKTVGLSVIF
jgi:hypothetical protein